MLRAIELSGFKSFADRTRLEFPDGISALVGPNGSGKSNIVDAIKWVLGERSPKKLRGGEMTDVIFNGSASRQALGAAEVTLTFDNSAKTFGVDLPEVHITRRIYRNGEGEYLINRQVVRLMDIEDMLSGTGLGNQAYSIIEQGRVESLLQSSPQQRRLIFEEAAGISRYNADKQKVLRQQERVGQNLIRLTDHLNETENQLRSTRSQAGKAQLYRQYSARLRGLRIQAGLLDYRKQTAQWEELLEETEKVCNTERELTGAVEHSEKNLGRCNEAVEAIDRDIRRIEAEAAGTQAKISGDESAIESQRRQLEQTEKDIETLGCQLVELNGKCVGIEQQLHQTNDDIRKAKESSDDVSKAYQKILLEGDTLAALCKEKQNDQENIRKELDVKRKQIAKLTGTVSGLESTITTLQNGRDQGNVRLTTLQRQRDDLIRQSEALRTIVSELEATAQHKHERLEDAKRRKNSRAQEHQALTQELSELKQKRSGKRERIAVLEELNRKYEGLTQGVRDVLDKAKDPKSPFRFVHGAVGNLLNVADSNVAQLIELALGPPEQYVVIDKNPELFRYVEDNPAKLAGRVGFIWLRPTEREPAWMKEKGFLGRPGVLGRADHFVKTDTPYAHLARRLLARTWIVENMSVARSLYAECNGETNFLTVNGEMLTAEGALIVGPKPDGLVTRRNELRLLGEQMLALDAAVAEQEQAVAAAAQRSKDDEKEFETETRQHQKAVSEYNARRSELQAADERVRQAAEHYGHLVDELSNLDTQIQQAADELERIKTDGENIDELIVSLERRQTETRRQVDEAERNCSEHLKKETNAKVASAKSEERIESLKDKIRQSEERLTEQQLLLVEYRQRRRRLQNDRDVIQLAMLRKGADLAEHYLKKEATAAVAAESLAKRAEWASRRVTVQSEWKRQQNELRKLQSTHLAKKLEQERRFQERKTLLDRIRDDYNVDLADESITLPQDGERLTPDPQSLNSEIEDLQQKIQKLGGVNPESITMLETLETQHASKMIQYNDILKSKKLLEEIREDIDVRCRLLFEETFEGVRHHFKELFQHLFGGGNADLVLEDPDNMLESGVDIVARPPGKDLKSVSLLSGGEKTLTCVALLLAFFRFRPNPVCILDEVDAALDEANIDRFVRVIKEFQTAAQFLLVTHSKKTMSAAAAFYGITMQESGISIPVSLCFEQVGENGEILTEERRRAA